MNNDINDMNIETNNIISTGLETIVTDTYSYINNLLATPSVIIVVVIILILYVLFMSLGDNNSPSSIGDNAQNNGSGAINTIFMIFIFSVFIIYFLRVFFGIEIMANIINLLFKNPEIDIVDKSNTNDTPVSKILLRPQVFNIPENNYIYSDAKALCSAYGSRLATYSEVEDAYKSGGEWCNYGWSDNQMALFPTQKKTYNELQKIEGHENDCGRPGINGGYIANPNIKFGVNCYGYKPRMNSIEKELMETEPLYPKTLKDIAMEKRVNYWKDKLSEILVSPFNHNSWSKI